jgi:hypothetical protein
MTVAIDLFYIPLTPALPKQLGIDAQTVVKYGPFDASAGGA